ncbi:MAG: phosphatase PAP2 family protein [Pseudomonadota bacterium]|nr:phosphatase PAP2 family protein [Pseudomonadota bacterium]
MDITLTKFINALAGQSYFFDTLLRAITDYGVYAMILSVAGLWFVGSDKSRNRNACIATGLSFILGLLINQVILLFLHRLRPYEIGVTQLFIAPNPDWSFPSDHATAAAAIVIGIWLFGPRKLASALAVVAVLVAFSSVYLGVHYVSDIAGGLFTAAIASALVWKFYKPNNAVSLFLMRLF